jgi:hypothetical protein
VPSAAAAAAAAAAASASAHIEEVDNLTPKLRRQFEGRADRNPLSPHASKNRHCATLTYSGEAAPGPLPLQQYQQSQRFSSGAASTTTAITAAAGGGGGRRGIGPLTERPQPTPVVASTLYHILQPSVQT